VDIKYTVIRSQGLSLNRTNSCPF